MATDKKHGGDGDWGEWSRHVLLELERLNDRFQNMSEAISCLRTDIAMLKVKSGIWGAIAGLIPCVLALIYFLIEMKW